MFLVASFLITFSIDASQERAISYMESTVQPVIQHSMEWAAAAAVSLTGLHGFIVVVKRFLD